MAERRNAEIERREQLRQITKEQIQRQIEEVMISQHRSAERQYYEEME